MTNYIYFRQFINNTFLMFTLLFLSAIFVPKANATPASGYVPSTANTQLTYWERDYTRRYGNRDYYRGNNWNRAGNWNRGGNWTSWGRINPRCDRRCFVNASGRVVNCVNRCY